jgi:hypothetical protein
MATREKSKRCAVCLQAIDPNCDWKQGRCPHRPPMIEIQPKDTSKGHFYVSLAKSALRIIAGLALIQGMLFEAGVFLVAAEILGVVEELV